MNNIITKPVVKWAGGKRQLLNSIHDLMPKHYNNYYEPFFGGGAVYFSLQCHNSIINDANIMLINMYRHIQDAPDTFMDAVCDLQLNYNSIEDMEEKRAYYYMARKSLNECIIARELSLKSASLFLFLNKTCFNGIYRENSKGLFNVSWGKKKNINSFEPNNIKNISNKLKTATIMSEDYKKVCVDAQPGDFVFFDPPYYDTFDNYKKGGFPKREHRNLAVLFQELSSKGVYCMLTNSNTEFIKELFHDYRIRTVPVKRNINCKGDKRKGEEIIITSY